MNDSLMEDLERLESMFRNVTQVRRVEAFRGMDGGIVDADGWEDMLMTEKAVFRTCANHLRELIRKHKHAR